MMGGKMYLGSTLIYDGSQQSGTQEVKVPEYIRKSDKLLRLTFCDDFDTPDINHNYWMEDYMPSRVQTSYNAYSDVRCEDSLLKLRVKKDMGCRDGTENGNTVAVSSIQSAVWNGMHLPDPTYHDFRPWYGLMMQEGYIECKAKIAAGSGVHSTLWMVGTENTDTERCEYDVFEALGNAPTVLPFRLHPNGDETLTQRTLDLNVDVDLTQDFHIYGMLWENGQIKLYLDGALIYTLETATPQYPLILFLGLYKRQSGTGWTGAYDPNLGDIEFHVDYVKIYKVADTQKTDISLTGYEPINISITAGNYTVNDNRGFITDMPLYCYLNWNDGSRTEHWVKWDRFDNSKKAVLDAGGTLEWEGIVYDIGIPIVATITAS